MKPLRVALSVCGVIVVLFLLVALVFDFVAPDPTDAAKAKAAAEGWPEQDLGVLDYKATEGLLGGSAHVKLVVKGHDPPKTIRVELRRPMWLPYWEVVAYEENPA